MLQRIVLEFKRIEVSLYNDPAVEVVSTLLTVLEVFQNNWSPVLDAMVVLNELPFESKTQVSSDAPSWVKHDADIFAAVGRVNVMAAVEVDTFTTSYWQSKPAASVVEVVIFKAVNALPAVGPTMVPLEITSV